jgi:hypothetical protein
LVRSVRERRGPKGICIGSRLYELKLRSFDSISFINALRGNSHLERLDLSCLHSSEGTPQELAATLRENRDRDTLVSVDAGPTAIVGRLSKACSDRPLSSKSN